MARYLSDMEFLRPPLVICVMTENQQSTLVFVYNADSGLFNTMTDIAHKMLSPSTYSCNLCAITHGLLSEKKEWRAFIEQLGVPVEFLHRDEFEQQYGSDKTRYPAVLTRDGDSLEVLLTPEQIKRCTDIPSLCRLISQSVK